MLPVEGEAGADADADGGGHRMHDLLQGLLRDIYGIELEKQLLACLKELSRLFNDSVVLDQYQAATLKALAAAAAAVQTDGGDSDGGLLGGDGMWTMDPRFLPALEKRFRPFLRQLSALGWGLSQQRELKVSQLVKQKHVMRLWFVSRPTDLTGHATTPAALSHTPGLLRRCARQGRPTLTVRICVACLDRSGTSTTSRHHLTPLALAMYNTGKSVCGARTWRRSSSPSSTSCQAFRGWQSAGVCRRGVSDHIHIYTFHVEDQFSS